MFTLFKNVKISISGKHHPRRGAKSVLVLFSKVNIFHTKRCPHLVSELLTREGGGGGAHKHFFDRDARPRTNFNYRKK